MMNRRIIMGSRKRTAESRKLELTVDDLTGKQSVRATFKLTKQVIDLLAVIAGQLGIKQKSLFDQLVENASIMDKVSREALDYSTEEGRHQKTFVISRSTLLLLNQISKKKKIPRDILVEVYIKQLLPVIKTELEKHQKRKELLREMRKYQGQGEKLLKSAEDLLGKDDMLYEKIKNQINITNNNVDIAKDLITKGMPMEDW
jgi:hypothetical protein